MKSMKKLSLLIVVTLFCSMVIVPGTAQAISTSSIGYYETTKSNVAVHTQPSGSSTVKDLIAWSGRVLYISEIRTNSYGNWWGKLSNATYTSAGIYDGSVSYPNVWAGGWVYLANQLGTVTDAKKHTHSYEAEGGYTGTGYRKYRSDNPTTHTLLWITPLYCRCGYHVKNEEVVINTYAHDYQAKTPDIVYAQYNLNQHKKTVTNYKYCPTCLTTITDGSPVVTYEVHSYVNGKCSKCGYLDPVPVINPVINSITASKTSFTTGEKVQWTASASGGTGALSYQFIMYRDGVNVYTSVYLSDSRNFIWYTLPQAGNYYVDVNVKDTLGKTASTSGGNITVKDPVPDPVPVTVTGVPSSKSSITLGDTFDWTILTRDGSGAISYRFQIFKDSVPVPVDDFGYVSYNKQPYQPREAGIYTITGYAKDSVRESSLAGSQVTVLKPVVKVSSIQLTPSALELQAGETKEIAATVSPSDVTNKALTWSSNNPGIAAVDQNGQITAVAPGSATITATAQDGSNVLGSATVHVSMPVPVISALSVSGTTATLRWGTAPSAVSYYVYRSVNSGAFAFLKGTTGTTISDPGLVVENSYTYRVQANGPGGSKSEMSAVRSVTLKLTAPVISSLSVSGTTATLRWGAVSGAESYYVYRSVNGGAFAFLKGTTGTQVTDTSLTGGNWVSYRVRANANSGAVSSMSSTKGITILAAPVIRSLGANGTTATLKWGAVSGAASYYVYRSVNGGAYSFLKGTTGITVNDPGLTVGSSYYYKVRANGSSGNMSALSALKGIKISINLAAPVISSLSVSGTTATLSWGKVTYAESYYVYRSVNGGAFDFLKGTTGTTIKDPGLVAGNSYAYRVQANGAGGVKSAMSPVKSFLLK